MNLSYMHKKYGSIVAWVKAIGRNCEKEKPILPTNIDFAMTTAQTSFQYSYIYVFVEYEPRDYYYTTVCVYIESYIKKA